jgi:hypothetical protein
MFRTFLRDVISRKHTSRNHIAAKIGIAPQELDDAIRGEPLDVDTTVAVCQWLKIPSSEMLAVFEEDAPDLVIILQSAAEEVRNQTMTEGDFRDIVKYALERIEARIKPEK